MIRLCDILETSFSRYPDRTALITEDGDYTYREMLNERDNMALHMMKCGVSEGDRIIILLPNCKTSVCSIFASSRVGATYILLNEGISKYQLDYIISDSQAKFMLTNRFFVEKLQLESNSPVHLILQEEVFNILNATLHLSIQPEKNDLACFLYTSGSTGQSKAVVSTHANILFAVKAIQSCLRIEDDDVIGNFLPLSFDYGMYQIFLAFFTGATLALGQKSDVGPNFLRKLGEWKVTGLPIVPTMGEAIIKLQGRKRYDLPKLRFITNTGAALPRLYINKLSEFFPRCAIFLMYGLTECKRVSILLPQYLHEKPNSVGRPLPGTHCVILDQDGKEVPPLQVGELVVTGPHVMQGYWNAEKLNSHFFRWNKISGEIQLFTGDFFWMDEDGFLYFYGRKDDIFKQNGYRVSSTEIEIAALDIESVNQASLVLFGEGRIPVLFTDSELSIEQIYQELKNRLEDYKLPQKIFNLRKFPASNNGKIDKKKLADIIKEGERVEL